jgi:hypothetical protein
VLVKHSDPEIPANYSQESTGYGFDEHGDAGIFDGSSDDGGHDCEAGGFDSEDGGLNSDPSSEFADDWSAKAEEWVPKRKRDPYAEWMPIVKQAIDTLQANCDDEICDFGTNYLMEFTATIQKMVCEKAPSSKRQRIASSITRN